MEFIGLDWTESEQRFVCIFSEMFAGTKLRPGKNPVGMRRGVIEMMHQVSALAMTPHI